MANGHVYEFYNDISSLGSKSAFLDAEFTEEHPEPHPARGKKEVAQSEPSEPAVEMVEGEIVENGAFWPGGRVLVQIHHPASGSLFTVSAPSAGMFIYWLFITADILAEAGCELWPVQGEPETSAVPYLCWAAAAYAYCLHKRVHPDP